MTRWLCPALPMDPTRNRRFLSWSKDASLFASCSLRCCVTGALGPCVCLSQRVATTFRIFT